LAILHHFLSKGWKFEDFDNLSELQWVFLRASFSIEYEGSEG